MITGGAGCNACCGGGRISAAAGCNICTKVIPSPPNPMNKPIRLATIHLWVSADIFCISARNISISAFVANVGKIAL